MIVTTYTCDRCGHSQEKQDQMWRVQVNIAPYGYGSGVSNVKEALWCRDCVEQFGLLPIHDKTKNEVIDPPPTLEDMIREIVRTAIEEV